MKLRPRGFALMDTMVSLVLGAVIAYVLYLFSTGVGRHYYSLTEKMGQIERASVFEQVLGRELQRTSPAGLTLSTPDGKGQTMTVQSFEATVPPGRLRWSDRVWVLRHLVERDPATGKEKKRLAAWLTSLKEIGVDSTYAHPETLSPTVLPGLPELPQADEYRTWDHVIAFKAEKTPGSPALRVTATFEQEGVRRNRHSYTTDRLYPIWNDFEP
jgi:hypothetical protein